MIPFSYYLVLIREPQNKQGSTENILGLRSCEQPESRLFLGSEQASFDSGFNHSFLNRALSDS